MAVNIEIKPSPGRERETGAAVAIDAAKLWHDAEVPPLLSSFSEAALAAAQETVPALPRAYLCDRLPPDWLERCAALGCIALDAKHTLLDASVIGAAHAAGLKVAAWTVNEPARARELAALGLDMLITDAIDDAAAPSFFPRSRVRPHLSDSAAALSDKWGLTLIACAAYAGVGRRISRSSTGRLRSPATTPSAIDRYQTMS